MNQLSSCYISLTQHFSKNVEIYVSQDLAYTKINTFSQKSPCQISIFET